MITISNTLKTIIEHGMTLNAKLVFEDMEITANDDLISLSFNDTIGDENGFIGFASAKSIDFEIFNKGYNLGGKEFDLYIWYEYLPSQTIYYGKYIISTDSTNVGAETSKYTAYDYMLKTDKKFEDSNTYPMTLLEFTQKACEDCGLELGNTDFVNNDFVLTERPYFDGQTYRIVFSCISQLAGGYAYVEFDNKMYIRQFAETEGVLDEDNSYEIKTQEEYYGEINKLAIGMTDIEGENVVRSDDESIELNGETAVVINDNPFLDTEEKRTAVIDNIFNAISGIKFLPFTATYYGFVHYQAGDLITVNGESTVILKHSFVLNGNGTAEAPSLTKTEIKYENVTNPLTRIRNAEFRVNKVEAEITSTVASVTSLSDNMETLTGSLDNIKENQELVSGQVTQLKQDLDSFDFRIVNIENNGVTKVENTLITIDINGIKVATSESAISTLITNDSFIIKNYDETLAQFNNDGAVLDNLTVRNYFTAGVHRVEKYQDEETGEWRTGWFYVGGEE